MQYLKSIILFISCLLIIISGQVANRKPLKITILYESLCRDSQLFFLYQLHDAYPDLKNYIDIEYVPFGKSDSHQVGRELYFTCQHGALECEGNRIQSCALNVAKDNQDSQTAFALCFMSSQNPRSNEDVSESAHKCARIAGIPFKNILSCMQSTEGHSLQLRDEKITKSFYGPLRFVPTIIYDDQFDQTLQDHSQSNFVSVICRLLVQKGININYEGLTGVCR